MFSYSDPVGTGLLAHTSSLQLYREKVHELYFSAASAQNSAFTLLEAFENVQSQDIITASIEWRAYPRSVNQPDASIDADRINLQDEYVEWQVIRSSSGSISKIIFTTEFGQYYQTLAEANLDALVDAVRELYPSASPTSLDLLGVAQPPTSGRERAFLFERHLRNNPWNNGNKGILCLSQGANTAGALFGLVKDCSINRPDVPADAVCSAPSCVPSRDSDPAVCLVAQNAARSFQGISLKDPVGIQITQLLGTWTVNNRLVDTSDSTSNQGLWTIERNGRRAVLDLSVGDVRLAGGLVVSGSQVARNVLVTAEVIGTDETNLPAWARTGQESNLRSQIS